MFYNRTCSPSPYFKVTYPVTAPSVFKATRGPALRHRISRLPISLQDLNTHRSLRSSDLLQHLFFLNNHALSLSLFYPTRHQSSHHPTQVALAPNVGKQVIKPKPEAGRPSGYKVDVALLLFTDKASEGANAAHIGTYFRSPISFFGHRLLYLKDSKHFKNLNDSLNKQR